MISDKCVLSLVNNLLNPKVVDKGKEENEKEEKVILGAEEMKMVEGEGNKIEGLEAKGESGEMLVDKVESEEMLEDKVESHEMVKMEEGEKDYGVNESKMKKWEKVWLDAWNLEMERRKTAKVLAEERSQVLRNSDEDFFSSKKRILIHISCGL